MKRHFIGLILVVGLLNGCATHQVSYQKDVAPILQSQCVKCHTAPDGSGYRATGLELNSYDAVMQGTVYGPIIVVGDSRRSIFNMLVEGRAGKLQRMPHQEANGLSEEEINLLSDWVNQGALNN
jgi:uncharacterized membrane protein